MKRLIPALLVLLLLPLLARAEETEAVYTILDANGAYVTHFVGTPEAGDEYIAHDNTHFIIRSVDESAHTAQAEGRGAYPLPDVLAMEKGILDPERDGDAIVFDFLTAVFNSGKLVAKYYDSMDSETIHRAVKIFKRLNHIDEKEERAKNREAKGTT